MLINSVLTETDYFPYNFYIIRFLSKQPALKNRYEDVDVAREKQRVLSGGAVNDVLRLEGLTKVSYLNCQLIVKAVLFMTSRIF